MSDTTDPALDAPVTWEEFKEDAQLLCDGMSKPSVDRRRRRIRRVAKFWAAVSFGSMAGGFIGNILAELGKDAFRLLFH